jgi:alkanesulfonate monooxygenase SsuD/methylene tetrahydromethanopterin reductase-like flavin-dependent oxidoreductase (luciferase family)
MRVGIGLPSGIAGAPPDAVVDWAVRAEKGPFSSLGTVDRIVYDSLDPLVALSAAAAVTERIGLVTCILIAPLREVSTLAKQVASLDALSGGRLTLGVAVGARDDDYEVNEFPGTVRGKRLTEQLARLRSLWEQEAVGRSVPGRASPSLLVGGGSGPAFARAARFADGYVHGGGPPRAFARAADQARGAWEDAGRPDEPYLMGQAYFALGDTEDEGRRYMLDYYAFTGPFAQRVADGLLTAPLAVRELVEGYADAGCDEVVLMPAVADPQQVDLLADVIG